MGAKPLCVRFDKIDGLTRVYNETKYLVLFQAEKYDSIDNKIRYLMEVRSGIRCVFSHNYTKIKADSYDSLPLENTLTFHVLILIKSVLSKDKDNYHYKIFLEKCLHK